MKKFNLSKNVCRFAAALFAGVVLTSIAAFAAETPAAYGELEDLEIINVAQTITAAGTLNSATADSGSDMEIIMTTDPTTVTVLVRMDTTSVAIQVEITSIS